MKGYMFRDQVHIISSCFEQWNHCEQLVFLYALVQKLTETQGKFIKMVLDKSLKHASQQEEIEANDPEFLHSLRSKPRDYVVEVLMSHLPLLHTDNDAAKVEYMRLIPKILVDSMNMLHIEESKRLLSYAVIHPALSPNERRSLTSFMQDLEIKNNQNLQMSTATQGNSTSPYPQNLWPKDRSSGEGSNELQAAYSTLQELGSRSLPAGLGSQLSHAVHQFADYSDNNNRPNSIDKNGWFGGESSRGQKPYLRRRSKSYSPVISSVIASQIQSSDRPNCTTSNEENLTLHQNFSNLETAPLSPQESIASSGSETNEESKNGNDYDGNIGMKDVGMWLKGLRLHKYSHLFENMTYDEMMNLSEDQLEKQNVTKGARHKIVISIQKLRERPEQLRCIMQKLSEGVNLREALTELKSILQTPIKPYHPSIKSSESHVQPQSPRHSPTFEIDVPEDDLPMQLTIAIVEAFNHITISNPDDETCNIFISIIDKCMMNEAFQPQHRRRLYALKQQLLKYRFPASQHRTIDNSKINRSSLPHPSSNAVHSRRRNPLVLPQRSNGSSLISKSVPMVTGSPNSVMVAHRNQQQGSCGVKQSASLNEHTKPSTLNIQRRNSAPVRTNQLSAVPLSTYRPVQEVVDPEIDTRLRSLCLSVTEHALAGSDGSAQY